jgi:hypothetical protein
MLIQFSRKNPNSQKMQFHILLLQLKGRNENIKIDHVPCSNVQSLNNLDLIYENHQCLKFQKVSKSAYSLLFSYPFSPLEAFALSCVSIHNEFF